MSLGVGSEHIVMVSASLYFEYIPGRDPSGMGTGMFAAFIFAPICTTIYAIKAISIYRSNDHQSRKVGLLIWLQAGGVISFLVYLINEL